MADGPGDQQEGPTTTTSPQDAFETGKTLTLPPEPQEEPPQIHRDPETVPLLEQVQAGQVVKVRSTEVVQVGKEDPEHTFTLQIAAPHETAEKVMALMNSGAAVFAVVGTRQYRMGTAPPEAD